MGETRTIEYKERITTTFLKTVSAFANYDGGDIYFGIDDNGTIKGLSDVRQACLDIENMVNNGITPQPDYSLEVQNHDKTIKLTVRSGLQKPYFYKSKAYKRNDTATIEVDRLELSRLILEGNHLSFEELPCREQALTFDTLCQKLKERIHLEAFTKDTLKTLNLYDSARGYNNAAGLLADSNPFPGIDMVKFGETISVIHKRATFSRMSVLSVYEKALAVFRDYYQYEEIQGDRRAKVERIPEAAFREAIANALIHRVWDVDAPIKVSLFDDRITIISPGGLPPGITEAEYLAGKLSVLRNRSLANVFYRLGLVEVFGTGIPRIKELYEGSVNPPDFDVSDQAITITLPLLEKDLHLTEDERKIYQLLSKTTRKSISDIAPYVDFGKSKTSQLLKELSKKGIVTIEGRGRGTKYILK